MSDATKVVTAADAYRDVLRELDIRICEINKLADENTQEDNDVMAAVWDKVSMHLQYVREWTDRRLAATNGGGGG